MLVFYFFFQTVYCITGKLARYVYEILWISIIVIQDCYILWIYHLFLFQTEYIVYFVSLENWLDMCTKLFEFQLLWSNIVISYEYFEGKKASHLFLFQTVYCITGKLAGYVYQIVWISIILIQYFHSNTYIIQKFWMLKCTFLLRFFLNVYTCWLIIDWSDLESESSNFDK